MQRRTFLAGSVTALIVPAAGCQMRGETDHPQAFQAGIENRDVNVQELLVDDEEVHVQFEATDPPMDIAAVSLAFVDQLDAGWKVERVVGAAISGMEVQNFVVEAEWAYEFLDEEISPEEYGARIFETVEPGIFLE